MNIKPEIVEWFKNEPMPGAFRYPAIVLGGTCLLGEFLDYIERSKSEGDLSITVPFVSSAVFENTKTWETLDHRGIRFQIVTKTLSAARVIRNKLGIYPWQSFEIRVLKNLHAKIYVFTHRNGGGACLIGSHNLTVSATKHNEEAGMLFISNTNDEVNSIIYRWHEQSTQLARQAVDISCKTDCNKNINLN